jgi:O-antigen ligase
VRRIKAVEEAVGKDTKGVLETPVSAKTEPLFSHRNFTRLLMLIFAFSAPLGHAAIGLSLFILAFPFLYRQYKRDEPTFSFLGEFMPPLVGLVLSSYLSVLLGTHPQKAFFYTTGLVLTAGTGIAAGRTFAKDKEFFLTFFMPLSLAATLLTGFTAIGQYFFLAPGSRATAFTGGPNILGTLILIFSLLGMAFLYDRTEKYHWLVIPYGIIAWLGLGATLSRAAWLGMAGGLILFSFHRRIRKKLFFVILIISVLAGIFFSLQPQWYNRFLSIFDPQMNLDRLSLWDAAYRIFRDHPLTGIGLGNFREILPDYREAPPGKTQPTPHNLFLNILSDMGLTGLAAFIWFMGKVAVMARFLWRYGDLFEAGVVVTLAALFINELFSHNLHTVQTGGIIWFLLGALSMLYQERKLRPVPGR